MMERPIQLLYRGDAFSELAGIRRITHRGDVNGMKPKNWKSKID